MVPERTIYNYYRKLPILQFSLIVNYPVSYNVDRAYKVILGLIFGSAWTKTSFDRMRKTRHFVSCKVLAWLDTELDISSWKLVCMDRKRLFSFREMSSILHVRGICLQFVGIIVLFEAMEAGFLSLTVPPGQKNESSRFAMCLPKIDMIAV